MTAVKRTPSTFGTRMTRLAATTAIIAIMAVAGCKKADDNKPAQTPAA